MKGANALETVWPTLEGVVRSSIVFKEKGMIRVWTVLGLAGLQVKFQTLSAFWFQQPRINALVVSSFYLEVSASCKNNWGMCGRPLFKSFRQLGVWWFCYVAELQSQLLSVPQANSYSLFLPFHIFRSLTPESAFYFERQWIQGLVQGFKSNRKCWS